MKLNSTEYLAIKPLLTVDSSDIPDFAEKQILELQFHLELNSARVTCDQVSVDVFSIFKNLMSLSCDTNLKSEDTTSSSNQKSNFFPLTCICGVKECLGLYSGIRLEHTDSLVSWSVPKKGYSKIKKLKRSYSFDKSDYELEALRAWLFLVSVDKLNNDSSDLRPFGLKKPVLILSAFGYSTPRPIKLRERADFETINKFFSNLAVKYEKLTSLEKIETHLHLMVLKELKTHKTFQAVMPTHKPIELMTSGFCESIIPLRSKD